MVVPIPADTGSGVYPDAGVSSEYAAAGVRIVMDLGMTPLEARVHRIRSRTASASRCDPCLSVAADVKEFAAWAGQPLSSVTVLRDSDVL